ncbi:MAG: hypothetical protein JWP43_2473 [Ramlibacter sp.]|jgi:hypothetical protein|nr:hypothetical protein [Ramlibacter sp.]
MRWFKPNIRSSLHGLLGNPGPPSDSVLDRATDDIRESMLALIARRGAAQYPGLLRRIRYAEDLQSLWYLRGDLMAAVAATRGETVARDKIAAITEQFQGLLPGGLGSRPSPLA